jgi:nitroreductase
MKLDDAIASRRSVRAFLPEPVSRETVSRILDTASRAPSGTNIQPWKVHVLAGDARAGLTRTIMTAREAEGVTGNKPDPDPKQPSAEPPRRWAEPYLSRRRKVGWDLYGLLQIEKGDKPAMWRQHGRNYEFFDAPVGLMFVIDSDLEKPAWLDLGMFMQNVMLAARVEGLDTCPQGAWLHYADLVHETLGLGEGERIASGMALGYADPDAPENTLVTERVEVDDFTRFRGF